jgi:phage-related protein
MQGPWPTIIPSRKPLAGSYRMYVAKFEEAVYVLHAFEKRSRQTRDTDLTFARERLKQVEALRREERRKR